MRKSALSRRSSTVVAFAVGAAVIAPLAFSSPAGAAVNSASARDRVQAEAGHLPRGGDHGTAAVEARDG
ncbi:hypothetical protein, partial [Streptomyces sp. SID3343]|uniref:hypothetical protein n=1 Tax=Streptomyces sp. SID3343 TaxID=2690260 RepID=UPI0013687F95